MASRFIAPVMDVGKGITPSDGAALYFFETGTATPRDTYSDQAGTIANANPVIADSSGNFPDIFINGTYKVVLKDKNGVQTGFGEADPVDSYSVQSEAATVFATVAALEASYLPAGVTATTQGYTTAGDGGEATYLIKTAAEFGGTPDEQGDHTLVNSNVAVLQGTENGLYTAQFGGGSTGLAAANAVAQDKDLYLADESIVLTADLTWADGVKVHGIGNSRINGAGLYATYVPADASDMVFEDFTMALMTQAIRHTNTNLISDIRIQNLTIDSCENGVYLICAANNVRVIDNEITNTSFAGESTAIQVGKDIDEATQGYIWVERNRIINVTNTSVTARDTHGILVRGFGVHVKDNTIENVTQPSASGTGCEGIYAVSHYSHISGNTLRNAGDDDASIIVKGGRDDTIIPQGSFGFANQIVNNILSSTNSSSSAIEAQADNTLIAFNTIEGFSDDGITVTANSNNTLVRGNYFTEFSGVTGINVTDSNADVIDNVIDYPTLASGTFTAVRINATTNAITRGDIKGNRLVISSDLGAAACYGVYFDGSTNAINQIDCVNDLYNESYAGVFYPIGYDGDVGVTTSSDFTLGGKVRGNYSDVFRNLDAYQPDNIRFKFDLGANARTLVGSTTVFDYESGRLFSDEGTAGTTTAILPAAKKNMRFTFVRTDVTQVLRVDPQITENVRTGGAGKFIQLNNEGDSVAIECFEDGVWDIVAAVGAYTIQA